MKKIFLFAVIVMTVFMHSSAQLASKRTYIIGTSGSVSSLKIDGDINVTLVIAPNEPNVYVAGSESFTKNVKISIEDGVMTVSAYRSSNSENDVVVIYASTLSLLELNGDIQLKTIGTINAEKLRMIVNGVCNLSVQHTGKLNISLDDDYEFTKRKVMRLKAN